MEENSENNTISINNQKRIKIKRNLLKFPSYLSNEELRSIQKRFKINFLNIQNNYSNLQENNIFKSNKKDEIIYKYIIELNKLKEEQKNKKQIIKKKTLSKKILKQKLKNKRRFTSINGKRLVDLNKNTTSHLFDYKHPYDYNFNNKKIESNENSIITNNNMSEQKSVKYLILKNQNCLDDLFYKNDEKINNNDKNKFLAKPKLYFRRISATYSSRILFENKDNNNILNKSQDKNFYYLNNSNIFPKSTTNIQDEEKNNNDNIIYKKQMNNDYDKIKSRNEFFNNKYNTISSKKSNIINNIDNNKNNEV